MYKFNNYDKWRYLPCETCGTGFRVCNKREHYICPSCKRKENAKELNKLKAIAKVMDIRTEYEIRFDKASDIIYQQCNEDKWRNAIITAEKASDKYDSIPEAVMAVILAQAKLSFIPQQKVSVYHVDFCIPKIKTIIEVDGSIYHADKKKVLDRDGAINFNIGLDWKIIHIQSEYVTKDVNKMYKYICKIRDTRDKK